MKLILMGWLAFFVTSCTVSILALTYVQLRAVARYGLRQSIGRMQRAPLDVYWRELSPFERGLVWTGFAAFALTFLAVVTWGAIAAHGG